jgi:hypothetical protein
MREQIHRFISAGEFNGYTYLMADDLCYDHYCVLRAYGIEIIMSIGLEDGARLHSIFAPTGVHMAHDRADEVNLKIWMALRIIHSRWVREHGPSPAASVFHDEAVAWNTLALSWL